MADDTRVPKLDTLLSAAARTFAARGYGGTSMRDIAQDSGISLSGIYYYTKGKAALLFEIQTKAINALLGSAQDIASSGGDPKEQLRRFIHNHISYLHANESFVTVLSHETADGEEEKRREVAEKRARYISILKDILKRVTPAVTDGQRLMFASDMLFAMMSGPNQWGTKHKAGEASAGGSSAGSGNAGISSPGSGSPGNGISGSGSQAGNGGGIDSSGTSPISSGGSLPPGITYNQLAQEGARLGLQSSDAHRSINHSMSHGSTSSQERTGIAEKQSSSGNNSDKDSSAGDRSVESKELATHIFNLFMNGISHSDV